MHEDLILGGPVWWFAAVLLGGAALLGLFVFFDSLFVRRVAFDRLPEPRWTYTALQSVFLLLLLSAQVPGTPRILGGIAVLATPFAIAQSLAYLLRAVFPRTQLPDTGSAPFGDESRT